MANLPSDATRIRILEVDGVNGFMTPIRMLATEVWDGAEYLGCEGPPNAAQFRAVCAANDANGDWSDASLEYMAETVARWIEEEPTAEFWATLGGAS